MSELHQKEVTLLLDLGFSRVGYDALGSDGEPYFIQKYTISTPSYIGEIIGEVDFLSFRSISQKFGLITLKELVVFFFSELPA